MDSQIEQLPDLSGYLKFASVPNWQRVMLAAPNSSDDAHTRSEARTFWQQWRATHAPHAPHAADASHAADARQTAAATHARHDSVTSYARGAATRTPASPAAGPNPSFARDGADHE